MTILWCGGEEIDFEIISGYDNRNAYYDAVYSRYQLRTWTGYAETYAFPTVSSAWLHCDIYRWDVAPPSNVLFIGLRKKGVNAFLGFGCSPDKNIIAAKYDGSTITVLASSGGGTFTDKVRHTVDMQIIDYGSNGTVNIFLNDSLVATYTGDISVLSQTSLDSVRLFGPGIEIMPSQIIVSTESTLGAKLKTIAPSEAGDTNDWTGTYANIDETTLSDSDKIYSATDNADFQCDLTGMPTGAWSVKAVKIAARCVNGVSATGIQLGVKSGGTVDSGDTQTASGYWQTKERLMQVNPVTGVAFTPAEIDALQINLRAKAL